MEEGGEVTRLEYEELLYEEGKEILRLKAEINDKDEKAKVLQIAFDRLFEENNHMVGWLQGIVDYEVDEVCKDGFAYDRLMNNLKNAARKGLGLSELEEEEDEKLSEAEDNARLISAAPEILEALEAMVEMVEMNGFMRDYAMEITREAIQKAEGEE